MAAQQRRAEQPAHNLIPRGLTKIIIILCSYMAYLIAT